MAQPRFKQASKNRGRKVGGKSRPRSFFRREAEWMTWANIAPFGLGVAIALIFWFTR